MSQTQGIEEVRETKTTLNGLFHSFGDNPAYILSRNGKEVLREWYSHGLLHREGKPAVITKKSRDYYLHGKFQTSMVNITGLSQTMQNVY